jgi:glutathione S-transferase
MAVKLHRCSMLWVKLGAHPCWRVQRELDAAAIDYEVVPGPMRRGKRDALEALSGQRQYPVIEFEDGRVLREESAAMAERIRAGRLFDEQPDSRTPAALQWPLAGL